MTSSASAPSERRPPQDDDANARHGDVETLRRLTREAFGEITSMRDGLKDLQKSVATERASRAAERMLVTTRVDHGTTLMGSFGNALDAFDGGLDAVTTVEAPFPGGDSLVVRFATGTGHGKTSPVVVLDKLMYRCRMGRNGWLRVAPIGGEGQDASATMNPLSKCATLTGFGARGSSLLAGCRGPALCG